MSADGWYVYQEGRQFGPLSEREIVHLVAYGRLRPDAFVWRPGFVDWTPARDVEGLYKPPPPPKPHRNGDASHDPSGMDATEALEATVDVDAGPEPVQEDATLEESLADEAPRLVARLDAVVPAGELLGASMPRPEQAEADRPEERAPSYLLRHWTGELNLAAAFWLNSVVLPAAVAVAIGAVVLFVPFDTAARSLALAGAVVAALPILTWAGVGLWRSARRTATPGGVRLWPRLAQAWVVLVGVVCVSLAVSAFAGGQATRFAEAQGEAGRSDRDAARLGDYVGHLAARLGVGRRPVSPDPIDDASAAASGGDAVAESEDGGPIKLVAAAPGAPDPEIVSDATSAPAPSVAPPPPTPPPSVPAPSDTARLPAETAGVKLIELADYEKPGNAAQETISLRNLNEHAVRNIAFVVTYKGAEDKVIFSRSLRMRGPIPPGAAATQAFPLPEGLRALAYAEDGPADGAKRFRVDVAAVAYDRLGE